MDREKFGAFLCELRKEKQLTQKKLGEMLHISDKAISKWERGQSIPDIEMISRIAEALEVSSLELLQGQRITEEKIEREQAEQIFTDTVNEAALSKKRFKKRIIIIAVVCIIAIPILLYILKTYINKALDAWSEANESWYHKCEINFVGNDCKDMGLYIYREQVDDINWKYHLMGVDKEGNEHTILVLHEKGKNLNRSPKIINTEEAVYILFEGLNNEDLIERLYGNEVGADPQGFLPHLYRLDLNSYIAEEIPITNDTERMLVDVATYQGEDSYLTHEFRGVFGDLHLGFYMGDKVCLEMDGGRKYENLFGDGGLKSTGASTEEGFYYIAGQKGIYEINLKTGVGEYVREMDLSRCYRSELKEMGNSYVLAVSFMDEVNQFKYPVSMHTEVIIFDKDWNEVNRINVPVGISAIEWGEKSLTITGSEEEQYKSWLVVLEESQAVLIEEAIFSVERSMEQVYEHPLDEMEQAREQWVYVPAAEGYYLKGMYISE